MASVKLALSCSCKVLSCCKSFFFFISFLFSFLFREQDRNGPDFHFYHSQNGPLYTRSSYFDTHFGMLLVTSSIYSLSVSNELLNFQNTGSRFVCCSLWFIRSCSAELCEQNVRNYLGVGNQVLYVSRRRGKI